MWWTELNFKQLASNVKSLFPSSRATHFRTQKNYCDCLKTELQSIMKIRHDAIRYFSWPQAHKFLENAQKVLLERSAIHIFLFQSPYHCVMRIYGNKTKTTKDKSFQFTSKYWKGELDIWAQSYAEWDLWISVSLPLGRTKCWAEF